jgi:hypothetical protein
MHCVGLLILKRLRCLPSMLAWRFSKLIRVVDILAKIHIRGLPKTKQRTNHNKDFWSKVFLIIRNSRVFFSYLKRTFSCSEIFCNKQLAELMKMTRHRSRAILKYRLRKSVWVLRIRFNWHSKKAWGSEEIKNLLNRSLVDTRAVWEMVTKIIPTYLQVPESRPSSPKPVTLPQISILHKIVCCN